MKQNDKALLQCIYKNAEMGRDSIARLVRRSGESGFTALLRAQYDDYNRVCMSAAALLQSRGRQPQGAPAMAKLSADAMIMAQTITDRSCDHLANMLIKGNEMGKKEIDDDLLNYADADSRIVNLARSLRAHISENTAELRRYV